MEEYREEVRTKPESRIKREGDGDGDGRGGEGDGGDVEKKIRTKPEKTTSESKHEIQ